MPSMVQSDVFLIYGGLVSIMVQCGEWIPSKLVQRCFSLDDELGVTVRDKILECLRYPLRDEEAGFRRVSEEIVYTFGGVMPNAVTSYPNHVVPFPPTPLGPNP